MATILKFKVPENSNVKKSGSLVSTSVDNAMLIIHHALHGSDKEYRPKDRELAVRVLDELSNYIKNDIEDEHLVLSHHVSDVIVERYPELH